MSAVRAAGAQRPLWGWLTAEAISLTGTRVSMVALPWFVLTTTGSPTKTGLIALFELTPMVLLKVLGGPLIDRFGRVRMLQALAAIGVAGLALFIFATEPWMLIVGTALWGIGCSLGFPVGMSAAADVPDRRLAASRVSAVAIIGYCAFLVGPPFIGFLGEHFGLLNALLVLLGLMVLAGIAAPAAREQSGPRARVQG